MGAVGASGSAICTGTFVFRHEWPEIVNKDDQEDLATVVSGKCSCLICLGHLNRLMIYKIREMEENGSRPLYLIDAETNVGHGLRASE